jgi:hypothetical protein
MAEWRIEEYKIVLKIYPDTLTSPALIPALVVTGVICYDENGDYRLSWAHASTTPVS